METCTGTGMNARDAEQNMPVALDPVPQVSKKRKASMTNGITNSDPMDSVAEKGVDETPVAKRAKATGRAETAATEPHRTATADMSSAKLQAGAEDGASERNRALPEMDTAKAPAIAEEGTNEKHTPLVKDSETRGKNGEAADAQPGTEMRTGDESTKEDAGVVTATKYSVPLAGRVVPQVPRGRASLQVTTATVTLSTSWKKKLEIKTKRQTAKAIEQEMRDKKRQEIEDKKQERLERERRRQRNEMKNTTYQTISKSHKMKTMNKKQLRQIKKRQINPRTGEEEFVSPWGGGKK